MISELAKKEKLNKTELNQVMQENKLLETLILQAGGKVYPLKTKKQVN